MCVKLFSRDLNLGLYPPHPTSTNTCEVTIMPNVCGRKSFLIRETINLNETKFYKDVA